MTTQLSEPPHWWSVTRKALVGSGTLAVFAVPTVVTWWVLDRFGAWDSDGDAAAGVAALLWIGVGWLVALLGRPTPLASDLGDGRAGLPVGF